MFFILIVVIALVAWALHLMQEAIQHKEFSLMLAGFLVSTAAAGMMAVYFIMSHYMVYMTEMTHRSYLAQEWANPIVWSGSTESSPFDPSEWTDAAEISQYRVN